MSVNLHSGRRAWDGDPPLPAAARRRLLEAAARCITRYGLAATSVAAIAAEAGVSRQTVYRYFTGRDEIASGAILAAAEGLRERVRSQIRTLADPADMIVEALVLGLAAVRDDPVLRAIWDSAPLDGFIAREFTGATGIAWTRETLAAAIEAAGWSEAEADAGLELVLRIFLSLIVSPSPERGPEEIRAFLYRHLVPGLGLRATEET
jgi:AcrR family transcriptional regulator